MLEFKENLDGICQAHNFFQQLHSEKHDLKKVFSLLIENIEILKGKQNKIDQELVSIYPEMNQLGYNPKIKNFRKAIEEGMDLIGTPTLKSIQNDRPFDVDMVTNLENGIDAIRSLNQKRGRQNRLLISTFKEMPKLESLNNSPTQSPVVSSVHTYYYLLLLQSIGMDMLLLYHIQERNYRQAKDYLLKFKQIVEAQLYWVDLWVNEAGFGELLFPSFKEKAWDVYKYGGVSKHFKIHNNWNQFR